MSINSKKNDFLTEYLNWKKPYVNISEQTANRKLSLRKKKLSEFLANKRMATSNNCTEILMENNINTSSIHNVQVNINNLDDYCYMIQSSNMNTVLTGLISIRKLTCISDKEMPLIDTLKNNNTLNKIIKLIHILNTNPSFLTEIFWILTNVTADNPSFNQYLYECDLITTVFNLLNSSYETLSNEHIESIAWMLGNFSNEFFQIRQTLNDEGVISFFINLITQRNDMKPKNKEKILFFLYITLSDTRLADHFEEKKLIEYSLKEMNEYLRHNLVNEQINLLVSYIKVISACCLNNINTFKYVCKKNGIQILFKFLNYEGKVRKIIFKILGDFAFQQKIIYSTTLLANNILDIYSHFLRDNSIDLTTKKEIAWTLSNLSSECPETLEHFFLHKDIIDVLFGLITFDNPESALNNTLNKELFWCISNLTKISARRYIYMLINKGYLHLILYYCEQNYDYRLPIIAIEGLLNVLLSALNINDDFTSLVMSTIANLGIKEKLYKLTMNDNQHVVKISETVIHTIDFINHDEKMEL